MAINSLVGKIVTSGSAESCITGKISKVTILSVSDIECILSVFYVKLYDKCSYRVRIVKIR